MVDELDWYIECATGIHREYSSSLGACEEALIGTLDSSLLSSSSMCPRSRLLPRAPHYAASQLPLTYDSKVHCSGSAHLYGSYNNALRGSLSRPLQPLPVSPAPSDRADPDVDASCVSKAQQGRTRTRSSRGNFYRWAADIRSRDDARFYVTLLLASCGRAV